MTPTDTRTTETAGPDTVTLITGANRGIGLATARTFADRGWTVLLGCRDLDRGREAAARLPGTVEPVRLDVTSDESVGAAAEKVRAGHGRLDVLVNNAGIAGERTTPTDSGAEDLRTVFETNVLGPVRTLRAFLPLLHASDTPRVVMVSSGVGSFGVTTDPDRPESVLVGLSYPASKAALNMLTVQYAKALPRARVNAVDPGYTATAFNGYRGHQPVEQGSEVVVALADLPPDGPTGAFFDRHGPVPW